MKPIKKVVIKDEKYEDGYSELLAKISENGNNMILLHGFIKKSQKIPKNELKTALSRLKEYQED